MVDELVLESGVPASSIISLISLEVLEELEELLSGLSEGTEITLPVSKSTTRVLSSISSTVTVSNPSLDCEDVALSLLDPVVSLPPQPQNRTAAEDKIRINAIILFILNFITIPTLHRCRRLRLLPHLQML